MSELLRGVLPVFQTPFHEDERMDYDTLEHEINWLFDCGADGIVMAMVSEMLRLSTDERRQLAEWACKFGRPRGAVVISVGAESSRLAEEFSRHAQDAGATALMAIPPAIMATTESELAQYYRRILAAVKLPVVVQDASGYVGRPMSMALQVALLDEFGPERVLFKPEAPPIGQRLTELREATSGRARVFEGTGGIALVDSYRRGIIGTMPGADLIKGLVALWRALAADDDRQVYRLSLPISSLIALATNLDAFLAIEKHLLVKQGVFKNTVVRGPTGYALDDETRQEVDRLFAILMEVVANEGSIRHN